MEVFAYLIAEDNQFLSIDNDLNIISDKPVDLSGDPDYIHLTLINKNNMEIEVLDNKSLKYIKNIKEIFINNIFLIELQSNLGYIIVHSILSTIEIIIDKENIAHNIKQLPNNFCKLNDILANMDKVDKNTISCKPSLYKDLSRYVSFKFNKESTREQNNFYDVYFDVYSTKEEAEYIKTYHSRENKNKLLEACK